MADYLLSRAFVSALDEAGVMQETVDAQGASERAQACLKGIDNFYREFYDTEVEPLIAQRLPESEIAARVRKPLDAAVDALAAHITAFMGDASMCPLSIPTHPTAMPPARCCSPCVDSPRRWQAVTRTTPATTRLSLRLQT